MTQQTTSPQPTSATSALGVLLRRAEHAQHAAIQPALAEHGVSLEHWHLLAVLAARPGLGMSELASLALLPAATVTRHMDRLVERALVVRHVDPADRRRVVAALSARGGALVAEVRAIETDLEARLATRLGAERLAEMRSALVELAAEER